MVDTTLVEEQLKKIKFNSQSVNRAETEELAAIILPDEEIFECANGWYEGGFALIVATNFRVLLIDKKPFKFLNVEDLRFDMINEIDYSHRLFDARIHISTGSKTLYFRSVNQQRLRKLISHVQHRMAEIKLEQKHSDDKQQHHLEQINSKLQSYLVAQYRQNQNLRKKVAEQEQQLSSPVHVTGTESTLPEVPKSEYSNPISKSELYEEGRKEIFKQASTTTAHTGRTHFSMLPPLFKHRHFGRALLKELQVHISYSDPEPATL